MNMFFFLKAQWELFGLRAPAFSWIASAGIIVYFIFVYLRQWRESKIRQRILSVADKKLKSFQTGKPVEQSNGISRHLYDEIDKTFSNVPFLQAPWQTLSSFIVRKTGRNGDERYWVSEDIGTIFNETITVENQNYRNAPGIITGVGLLATFLAILVALLDMQLVNNKIQGLDLLIHGLSGKFLSSVVAVACATLLISAEKGFFQPVKARTASLCITLRKLLPRITSAQILLDLHGEIVEESKILKNLGSGLALNLNQGLAETIGPAMERMATRFNESLAGATQGQFGQISETLGTTALLLQGMNSQFGLTGNVLNELMDAAKRTTANETANRESHIEQVTEVVGDLMGKLQNHTGESVGSMEKALAAITCDMSRRMTELSAQMASVVENISERSAGSAKEVLDQAGSLTARSAEQLALLLESHSAEMAKVDDLKAALDGTLRQFSASIGQYSQMTDNLEKMTTEVNTSVASLAGITKSVADSQQIAVGLLSSSAKQMESLKGFSSEQQEVWQRIESSMTQYEAVFQKVEGHAKELLTQIARHLGGYSTVTEKHFNMLTTTADNFISQASGRLSGSIDELGEQLDELHSAVTKIAFTSQSMR
jgi:methyl-accepting chemotaxis protein